MPRLSRTVFAGVPHHVTQRGNRRETVFFTDEDRYAYLNALREYCRKHRVEVLANCLMSNHIHLIAVPDRDDGLERVLRPLHMRHAQRVNRNCGWKGHLWQGRFFSSPLDEQYLWAAIRYVERNPVRAKMVRKAENYAWSSAAGHCGLRKDTLLNESSTWLKQYEGEGEWSAWLAETERPEQLDILRRHVEKGLPCGAERFVRKLERMAGRALRHRAPGRPRKLEAEAEKG